MIGACTQANNTLHDQATPCSTHRRHFKPDSAHYLLVKLQDKSNDTPLKTNHSVTHCHQGPLIFTTTFPRRAAAAAAPRRDGKTHCNPQSTAVFTSHKPRVWNICLHVVSIGGGRALCTAITPRCTASTQALHGLGVSKHMCRMAWIVMGPRPPIRLWPRAWNGWCVVVRCGVAVLEGYGRLHTVVEGCDELYELHRHWKGLQSSTTLCSPFPPENKSCVGNARKVFALAKGPQLLVNGRYKQRRGDTYPPLCNLPPFVRPVPSRGGGAQGLGGRLC